MGLYNCCPFCPEQPPAQPAPTPISWTTFSHPSGLNGDVLSSQEACPDPSPTSTELGPLLTATSFAPDCTDFSTCWPPTDGAPQGMGGAPVPIYLPLHLQYGAKFQPLSGFCQWPSGNHLPQEGSPDYPRPCEASSLLSHSPLSRCLGMPG